MNVVELVDAARRFFTAHRHRLARITAVVGLVTVALVFEPKLPKPVEVEVSLGDDHAKLTELRIEYRQAGEEVQGVSFSYPTGAPANVHHVAKLPAGDFEVVALARSADGRALSKTTNVHAPFDGTLRIRLSEDAR
jgi:hypothetical protein